MSKSKEMKIKYSDLWGLREEKYKFLETHDLKDTQWQEIKPREPYYFFVPKEEKGRGVYEKFWKVADIFPLNSVGVVTGRDDFVIDYNKQSLEVRIFAFNNKTETDEFIKSAYSLKDKSASHWSVRKARQALMSDREYEKYFTRILYRPFDERWIYYHPAVVERTRKNVMRHMLRPNLALSLTKRHPTDDFYSDVFVSNQLVEGHLLSGALGITYVLPLYLYDDNEKRQSALLREQNTLIDKEGIKKINLNPGFIADSERAWDKKFVFNNLEKHNFFAVDIFYYIYAVLYSNIYRQKYQEFLKIDFPRVPFTKNYLLFQELAVLGNKLVDLHLLKSSILENPTAKFHGQGNGQVETRKYEANKKRVYISAEQYFEPIEKNVWEYLIGGYQVLDKWLKDRKGRSLSSDDIKHYCHIITALSKTVEIQKQIDRIYPEVEKDIINQIL